MFFKIVGKISDVEAIATGRRIRELRRLRKHYGGRRWRKLKGIGRIELPDGTICLANFIGTKLMEWARRNSRSSAF